MNAYNVLKRECIKYIYIPGHLLINVSNAQEMYYEGNVSKLR